MSSIAGRLKSVRSEKGLNQSEMADFLGLKRSAYSEIERGSSKLQVEHVKIIVKEFSVNPYWILYGIEPVYTEFGELDGLGKGAETQASNLRDQLKGFRDYLNSLDL